MAADGAQNPTSKRRVLARMQQGILKATQNDSRIDVLDAEAEKAEREKKATKSSPAIASEAHSPEKSSE